MSAKICARCEHFRFRDDEGIVYPQVSHGIARCNSLDGQHLPTAPFVPWDGSICVLFGVAADVGARLGWIDKQRIKEGK